MDTISKINELSNCIKENKDALINNLIKPVSDAVRLSEITTDIDIKDFTNSLIDSFLSCELEQILSFKKLQDLKHREICVLIHEDNKGGK